MFQKIQLPGTLRWILRLSLMFLLCMTAYRIFFFYQYRPDQKSITGSMLWLGFRYDLRAVSILGLSLLVLQILPVTRLLRSKGNAITWSILVALLFCICLLFHMADYYHYDYLKQRLNASVLNFLTDFGISSKMVWQTYPVLSGMASLILLSWIFYTWHRHYLKKWSNRAAEQHSAEQKSIYYGTYILLSCFFCFGTFSQYPLRWSDAYALGDEFKASASLNPFQSFFSTLKFRQSSFDSNATKKYYPLFQKYYQLTDTGTLNFNRTIEAQPNLSSPNVVLVICESFSASKSSMGGNGLNPTPFFDSLCRQGLYFSRCFVPTFGTARGVWATLTGIPDVQEPSTASRDPRLVNQHMLINDFNGYEKFYFLGGSTTWANIRGVLKNNIDSLQIYEQEQFTSEKVDVWGISDKNLFLEADQVLKKVQKPFFAVIQTADNHRPYTIPAEDLGAFKKISYPEDTLRKYGFESNEQLNAFRYTDFTMEVFIKKAQQSPYFKNTIFAFVGDHGLRGNAGIHFPKSYTDQGITAQHVPLLFYAPSMIQPNQKNQVCSQLDVMPTLSFLAGIKTLYRGLGINLMDTSSKQSGYAFIADPDQHTIGMVSNGYYYRERLDKKTSDFVSIIDNQFPQNSPETDRIKSYLCELARGFYETSRYLLFHNPKNQPTSQK